MLQFQPIVSLQFVVQSILITLFECRMKNKQLIHDLQLFHWIIIKLFVDCHTNKQTNKQTNKTHSDVVVISLEISADKFDSFFIRNNNCHAPFVSNVVHCFSCRPFCERSESAVRITGLRSFDFVNFCVIIYFIFLTVNCVQLLNSSVLNDQVTSALQLQQNEFILGLKNKIFYSVSQKHLKLVFENQLNSVIVLFRRPPILLFCQRTLYSAASLIFLTVWSKKMVCNNSEKVWFDRFEL
jgi:hypothetical protein